MVWLEEDTIHDHDRKFPEISTPNQSENKEFSTESEAIGEEKIVTEMREII